LQSAPTPTLLPASAAPRARRGVFLKWLRKTHGWLGLWGAVLGLLFGVTGILQNHRAVLKIPTPPPTVSSIRLHLTPAAAASPEALAAWLQSELKLDSPARRVNRAPAQPVAWGDITVKQPERWTVNFSTPTDVVEAEYWLDSGIASVRRRQSGVLATIENLHRANGVGVAWVLLSDSIAGCLILLSITGVLIWTELNKRKTVGVAILIAAAAITLAVAGQTL
jgi:hypothetical protein